MPRSSRSLLHGTLDALILKVLSAGGRHGYGIARAIEDATERAIKIEEGSLYPSLYRMEKRGWIRAEWGLSERGRKAKFYHLTERGREHLESLLAEWAVFSAAVSKILRV